MFNVTYYEQSDNVVEVDAIHLLELCVDSFGNLRDF